MTTIVTGAAGFIGFHLAKSCLSKGMSVTSISTKYPRKDRKLRGVNENAVELLRSADLALEEARTALSDRNAPAVERALSRASNSIIQADPKTELLTTNILFDED